MSVLTLPLTDGQSFDMKTAPINLPVDLVWSDPERLGGRLCFRDTRVPVDALFQNLEDGVSLAEFLEAFEGVSRE